MNAMTNENLIAEVRSRVLGLEFSTRWLILELARRYEANISKPSDVVEVQHGRWAKKRYEYVCSICGGEVPDDGYWFSPFCPSCGAKMDGKDDNK